MTIKSLRRRVVWRAIGVAVAVSSLAACSSSGSASSGGSDAKSPILIGQSAGLTGFMSIFDIPVQQGIKAAIADFNAKGGVLGHQLEYVSSDNGTDTSRLTPAAQQLLDKGVKYLIPSCDFDIGGPAAQLANSKGALAIGCAGAPLFGAQGIGPNVFNLFHGSPAEGAGLAELAHNKGYKHPFVIKDQGLQFTVDTGDYFVKRWTELAGKDSLAGVAIVNNSDSSITNVISQIKSHPETDAIVLASYPPGGASFARQIRGNGLNQMILGGTAFDGTYWLGAVPSLSNFEILSSGSIYGDDPDPAINAFFARIAKDTGKPPSSAVYPLMGYSAVQAIVTAMQNANSIDPAKVVAAMDKFTNQQLLVGSTTWTPTCHIALHREMRVIQYTNGKPSVVGKQVTQEVPPAPC
jgi:branched-chain amino acid transport system substrate-binding protein